MLPALMYATAGAIQAQNEGEKFQPATFAKTIIAGALGAGLLSQTQADELTAFTASGVFILVVDKFLTAIERAIRSQAAASAPAAPPSSPSP